MWNIDRLLLLSFLSRSCIRFFRDFVCTKQIAISSMSLEHLTALIEIPRLLTVLVNLVLTACIY